MEVSSSQMAISVEEEFGGQVNMKESLLFFLVQNKKKLFGGFFLNLVIIAIAIFTLKNSNYSLSATLGSLERSGYDEKKAMGQSFTPLKSARYNHLNFYLRKKDIAENITFIVFAELGGKVILKQTVLKENLRNGKNSIALNKLLDLKEDHCYYLEFQQNGENKHGLLWNWDFYKGGDLYINGQLNPIRDLAFELIAGKDMKVFEVISGQEYSLPNKGTVRLNGSLSGQRYQLLKDAQEHGSEKDGTGRQLIWANLVEGEYTVFANWNSPEKLKMRGKAVVQYLHYIRENQFRYKKVIQLNGSHVFGELENFPLLLKIEDEQLTTFLLKNDSKTIAFSRSDNQVIPSEVERFDPEKKCIWVWVKMPKLTESNNTQLLLHFGLVRNSSPVKKMPVWNDFLGVFHGGNARDASRNFNTEELQVSTSEGIVGNAFSYSGMETFHFGKNEDVEKCSMLEVSFWLKRIGDQKAWARPIWYGHQKIGQGASMGLEFDGVYGKTLYSQINDGTTFSTPQVETGDLPDNEWSYVVIQFDGSELKTFVNNKLTDYRALRLEHGNFGQSGMILGNGSPEKIGFVGSIDEFRILGKLSSNNWRKTAYENMKNPSRIIKKISPTVKNSYFETLALRER